MYIDVCITNDRAELIRKAPILEGSKGYYKIRALFTEDWNELSKYIVFPAADCSLALDGDSVDLPEALIAKSGCITFGFVGLAADDSKRISTNLLRLCIDEGATETDTPPPSPDADSTWESYIGNIANSYLDEMRKLCENVKTLVSGFTVFGDAVDNFDFDNPPVVFAAYVRNTARGNSYAYYYSVMSLLDDNKQNGVQIRLRCSSDDLQIRHRANGAWSAWKSVSSWKSVDA